ncbi:hypothetical protein COHA_002927 [Chlorella ohadii]|uniref:Mechanosensitive ion channel MscS domain-containing protein n=1 Tax=Chlorella ohadii TaxID=2649997 RepID=A0AAD5DZQ8_9CHLO|nr:hypothetical protein COHA_002927 [Chlorella ohadii]
MAGVCCGSAASKAASASTTIAGAAVTSWFKATGVPLLEALQQLTLQQAALRSAGLVAATVVGVAFGNWLLELMGNKMEHVIERTRNSSGLDLVAGSALASVHRPAKLLLPLYGLFYCMLVVSAFADVLVSHLARSDPNMTTIFHVCTRQVLEGIKGLAQLMQDTSELVVIVFLAWFLISWKDELLNCVTARLEGGKGDEGEERAIARVLVPLSNLLTWGIVATAGMTAMVAFGVNVQPLLTFGSISTVAVGFAAQSTMQNVVSALQIYSSRPFIIGDRIQLKTLSGSTIVAGVVESIAPMRTLIRSDQKLPVYINNKDVMNLIVVNESKLRRAPVAPKLPLIEASLVLRYQDADMLPAAQQAIEDYLSNHPLVDKAISPRCVLAEFTNAGPRLALRALLQKSAAGRQAYFQAEMLTQAERIVRSLGGYLAISHEYLDALPPSPPAGSGATAVSGEFGATPAGP